MELEKFASFRSLKDYNGWAWGSPPAEEVSLGLCGLLIDSC